MRLDQQYIEKVLPGNVQMALSKMLEESLDLPGYIASDAARGAVRRQPKFVEDLGNEINHLVGTVARGTKVAQALDRVADSLESQGFFKEAEEVDILANTLEAAMSGALLKNETDTDELRRLIQEQVRGKPGYLANKVGIIKKDPLGRQLMSTEGRVYTTERPDTLLKLWKEGPDGNWYLQDAGDEYDVVFMGDKGYLQDREGKMHAIPGMREVTDL